MRPAPAVQCEIADAIRADSTTTGVAPRRTGHPGTERGTPPSPRWRTCESFPEIAGARPDLWTPRRKRQWKAHGILRNRQSPRTGSLAEYRRLPIPDEVFGP